MKKKLALLLVLTMILSAIPMNVFGATTVNHGTIVQNAPANSYVNVTVDLYDLLRTTPYHYRSDLNMDANAEGFLGYPVDVKISDTDRNGAVFGLDTDLWMPGYTFSSSALTKSARNILATIINTNKYTGAYNDAHGSARVTVLDSVNGVNFAPATTMPVGETNVSGSAIFRDVLGQGLSLTEQTVLGVDKDGNKVSAALPSFDELVAEASTTDPAFAPTSFVTQWNAKVISATQVRFYIQVVNAVTKETWIPDVPAGAMYVNFSVPVYLPTKDAVEKSKVTIRNMSPWAYDTQLAESTTSNYSYYTDYTIIGNTVAKFANTGFLDKVSIREAIAGYLDTNTAANPAANTEPASYLNGIEFRLNHAYARLVNNSYEKLRFNDILSSFHEGDGSSNIANEGQYNGYVTAEWGSRSYAANNAPYTVTGDNGFDLKINFLNRDDIAVPDTLDLVNLFVSFDDRMPYNTDVKLQYRKTGDTSWTDGPVVVQRSDNAVELGWVTGRSTNVAKEATDVVGVSGRRDVVTEVIRLKEAVPNSWNTATTTFSVPEGVEIVGAHAALYDVNMASTTRTRKEGTNFWKDTDTSPVEKWEEVKTSDTNGSTEYVQVDRHQNFYNGATIQVDEKQLKINPMLNYVTTGGTKRELEIQLKLSVEAGYEAKYGSDVALSVETSAETTAQSITAVTIHDPITATLAAEALELPTEANYNVSNYVIGDVEIVEAQPGDIRQNSELWLYVIGSSNLDLNLDADRRPVVLNADATTFAIYDGTQLRHTFGNFFLNGLRFDIQRASNKNAATGKQEAAEIAIENVRLSGTLQPGAEYKIVVSGSAVAENDYTVWTNQYTNTIANSYSFDYATDAAGIFDTNPYELDPFTWDADAYEPPVTAAPPVDDTTTGPIATISAPQDFNASSIDYDTDADGNPRPYNSFTMAAASNGAGYTGISPRAFAKFVGGDVTDWDETTGTVTITGINQQTGAEVVVSLTLNSTEATVDGQTYDIATYNDALDLYPAGSIKPFQPGNNRMYLPIRFLTKAYAVRYNWDGLTKTVTLYPGV